MLCALLTPLTTAQLKKLCDRADWKEAGVSLDDFLEWWKGHVEKDQKRLVKQALSKLTPAERRALKV